MSALHQVTDWPVDHVGAAILTDSGVDHIGELDRPYRLASLSKPMTAWAILVAVEEGVIDLDRPLRHVTAAEGATMRHLLSHASGLPFDGTEPIAPIERTRIYSNTGIELAADELATEAAMPFGDYFRESVVEPLGLAATALTRLAGARRDEHARRHDPFRRLNCGDRPCSPRRPSVTRSARSTRRSEVSFQAWADSIVAPGDSGSSCTATSRRTGWVAPTPQRRSVTSAARAP